MNTRSNTGCATGTAYYIHVWDQGVVERDPSGQPLRVVGLTADISERKRVEEQVWRSEQRLRQMMETSQVGIAFAREDGRVLAANDALLALLGRTRAELEEPGLNWRQFTLPCDDAYNEALRQRIGAQGYLPPFERRFLHKDGREIPVMLSASLLAPRAAEDPAAGEGEHVTFAVDLSELKQVQAALEELNATLEQRVLQRTAELERSNRELARSNRELDRFAYITSHDLKSPLRGIDNLASWIVQDAADVLPSASREHLDKLRGRVRRLEALLDDLLLYSRAGRRRHAAESVDTRGLVLRLVEELKPPRGMEIRMEGELPRIRCERAPFVAALRSLIENAIKHHHQPAAGVVAISAAARGEWVEFCVADNGPGIDPQYHERIFDVFQTLRPRDELEGSGMGLAIVKKTVESAGGRVWVESAAGEGAAFRFTWPVRME
jgi:PAS domain S-box-containing protein